MTASSSLFRNPVFKAALVEIEGLGFRVSERPTLGSIPYGIIGGRSNQRWWLLPLNHRRLTVSSLALFQPIVVSAKLLKNAAVIAGTLGLSAIWIQEKVYISGHSNLEVIFSEKGLYYAFFTGTDSPHRKVAVQIMDQDGRIKGFAKVSQSSVVKPLLKHEAKTLAHLNTIDFQTALIPKVLFSDEIDGKRVLVTDSLKTASTKTVTALNDAHILFLHELTEKTMATVTSSDVPVVTRLRKQYDVVVGRLNDGWRKRFEKAHRVIERYNKIFGSISMHHGDFTAWNTFMVGNKLYVFDWEYAGYSYTQGYDLIHFMLSLPAARKESVNDLIAQLRKMMRKNVLVENDAADVLTLACLCDHILQYVGRDPVRLDECYTDLSEKKRYADIMNVLLNEIN